MTQRGKQTERRSYLYPENHLHDTERRWFAVWVEVKCEKMAAGLLAKKRIETYLPLQKKMKHYRKQKPRLVEQPLIPGYVFVKIVSDEYIPVLQTEKVKGFLRVRKNLLCIPEREIDLLRYILGQTEYGVFLFNQNLQVGDRVRVVRGPFMNQQGVLARQKNKHVFVIRLEDLDQNIAIEIPKEDLERI